MLIHQAVEKINDILEILDDDNVFIQHLDSIDAHSTTIYSNIIKMGESHSKASEASQGFHSLLAQISQQLTTKRPSLLYISLESLRSAFENLAKDPSYEIILTPIRNRIDEFSRLLDNFFSDPRGRNSGPLIAEANALRALLTGFVSGLTLAKNFVSPGLGKSNADQISISIPNVETIPAFAEKLLSISVIYSELCQISNISEIDHPLVISKIESGSLFISADGEKKILKLISDIIESSAAFVYRNFTKEGKISAIPKKLESLEAILQFSERLEQAGIDTTDTKEQLAKTAHALATNLNILIEGQPRITINKTTISIGNELERQFIETRLPPKLEHNDKT